MIAQVRRYGLLLRLANFALPPISFLLAGNISVHWIGLKSEFTSAEYLYLALFTTMVWSIVAEWQDVTSIAKISAENTGLRASSAACAITYAVILVALFLVHQLMYSRLIVILSAVILFVLTTAVRTLFRIGLREVVGHRPVIKVLIVGASRFAARATARVQHNEFVRCRVLGYVQCPGEEIHVSNAPVFQIDDLDRIEQLGIDDILVAVSPEHYGELPRFVSKLQGL